MARCPHGTLTGKMEYKQLTYLRCRCCDMYRRRRFCSYMQVGCGADELIDLLMRCVLDPNDKIIDCPPTFTMYVFDAAVNDAQVVTVPRLDGFKIDLEGWLVTFACSSQTKIYLPKFYSSISQSCVICVLTRFAGRDNNQQLEFRMIVGQRCLQESSKLLLSTNRKSFF